MGIRIRWPFTILLTVVCGSAIWALLDGASAPVAPDCFEYCEQGAATAGFLILLILTVWLTVTVVAAWLWSRATTIHCPRCREAVEPSARVCPKCWYDLIQDVEPTPNEGPSITGPSAPMDQIDRD